MFGSHRWGTEEKSTVHRALPGGASLRCEQNVHTTYIQGRLGAM